MMRYTSGPWEVRFWNGDEWPDKRISISSEEGAIVISPRYESKRFMHDAQLISAAPDLLSALEDIVAQDGYDGLDYYVGTDLSSRVKEAINKAIGGQAD
jgi:hypothetical protein